MGVVLDLLTAQPLYLGFFKGLKDLVLIPRDSNWWSWRAFTLQCGWLIPKPLNLSSPHVPEHFAYWKLRNLSLSLCVYGLFCHRLCCIQCPGWWKNFYHPVQTQDSLPLAFSPKVLDAFNKKLLTDSVF